MKRIDGGIGGGQVLRLALTLAALDGTPVTVENVRGARETPGLRPQHVAAVAAVAALADADCEGVEVGSETVTFKPGDRVGGSVNVDVGTAGSITLIFDAVLPLVLAADDPIEVRATGGTDVKWSPPIDYLRHVKLPTLASVGLRASIGDLRRGFYPAGGGHATLRIEPSSIGPIDRVDRGALESLSIRSIATTDLEDADVVTRQIDGVREAIEDRIDVTIGEHAESVESRSTGTAVLVIASYERSSAGFSALGEPGVPAETVGNRAAEAFRSFHATAAAVDEHLADQLLPFLARRGGTLTTPRLTDHIRSSVRLLAEFGHQVDSDRSGDLVRLSATPGD